MRKLAKILTVFAAIFLLLATASCNAAKDDEIVAPNSNAIVVYFSRAGENWQVGNVEVGNTKIFAEYAVEYAHFVRRGGVWKYVN